MDEELADAAARELQEETGLKNIQLEQLHTFGKCGRDPRGRQITIAFIGIAQSATVDIRAGDDASRAAWFDIDKLPDNLAFDHAEVLEYAKAQLKK